MVQDCAAGSNSGVEISGFACSFGSGVRNMKLSALSLMDVGLGAELAIFASSNGCVA